MGVDIYPPSQPSGMTLAYAEVTALQTGISTETDLTGLTVTVTVPTGRRIRVTGQARVDTVTTAGHVIGRIKEGATELSRWLNEDIGASQTATSDNAVVFSPTAGTHTYKLTLEKFNGGNTVTMVAGATQPAFILVEDITGTIYPAGTMVTAGIIASEQWAAYTPTWVQSATITNTVLYSRYIKLGRTVIYSFSIQATGAGTASNTQSVVLPFTPALLGGERLPAGTFTFFDTSANTFYHCLGILTTASTSLIFYPTAATGSLGSQFLGLSAAAGNTTAAVASGDTIAGTLTYEATT